MAFETFLIGSCSCLVLRFASTNGIVDCLVVLESIGIVDYLVVLESWERPDKNLGAAVTCQLSGATDTGGLIVTLPSINLINAIAIFQQIFCHSISFANLFHALDAQRLMVCS